MVITPHALVGALVARSVRSLSVGCLSAVASHAVLDMIPHTDYSVQGRAGRLRACADMAAAGVLLAQSSRSRRAALGAMCAVAPDLLHFTQRGGFLGLLRRRFDAVHTQCRPPLRVGLTTQLLVGGGAFLTLRGLSRRDRG